MRSVRKASQERPAMQRVSGEERGRGDVDGLEGEKRSCSSRHRRSLLSESADRSQETTCWRRDRKSRARSSTLRREVSDRLRE